LASILSNVTYLIGVGKLRGNRDLGRETYKAHICASRMELKCKKGNQLKESICRRIVKYKDEYHEYLKHQARHYRAGFFESA
jgi:hypothetical protein